MKKVATYISIPFFIIPIFIFLLRKNRMTADLLRYQKEVPFRRVGVRYLCYCLIARKEYRSVFAYRAGIRHFTRLLMLFCPPLEQIEINTSNIGSGMRLFHKMGCQIGAARIGTDFSCGQNVTIGIGKLNPETGLNRPVIGNRVWIGVNAIIIGGITIGDDVTVGAGSVVVHDVEDGCTVVGNPARVIHGK